MENIPPEVWAVAHALVARNETSSSSSTHSTRPERPPVYKAVGLTLAIASGLFIGTSFVLKKTGLLRANEKYNEEAGEGYGYLKNAFWWSGMTLMIVGEICNFVAYAFVDAILVTPLGALSVVVTTVLSAIFLKERLSFVGKVGCFQCIIGSIIIVMNAPEQSSVADIQEMKRYVLAPGFLSYAGVIIIGCAFVAFWVGPRYGKKSMLVYLSICSLIGGLSVVATQGLGAAIVAQAGGKPQFNQWFLYLLLVFVVATLVTEIIYLNKALNLFNAALVTPTYYVFFTSATIVTSAILFQGFKGGGITIATVIMGFLVICSGVVLLQMSKSAKDVPDAAVFKGDLDQIREIGEVEQPETEPKADALRGAAALIRRISVSRQRMEEEEARRLREEKLQDHLEPLAENEVVEWDGLRRRKTVLGEPGSSRGGSVSRRKTLHPPLGMSRFPDPEEEAAEEERQRSRTNTGLFTNFRQRANTIFPVTPRHAQTDPTNERTHSAPDPVPLSEIKVSPAKSDASSQPYDEGSKQEHVYGLPPGLRKTDKPVPTAKVSLRSKPLPAEPSSTSLRPPLEARRQFSFTNFLHRNSKSSAEIDPLGSRKSSISHRQMQALKSASEEERLGLVQGDSRTFFSHHRRHPDSISQPMLSHYHSHSNSLASLDEKPYSPSIRRRTSLSDSDEDDAWQMAVPPTDQDIRPHIPVPPLVQLQQPPSILYETPNQQEIMYRQQSPPSVYRPPLLYLGSPDQNLRTSQTQVSKKDQTPSKAMQVAATKSDLSPSSSTSQTPTIRPGEQEVSVAIQLPQIVRDDGEERSWFDHDYDEDEQQKKKDHDSERGNQTSSEGGYHLHAHSSGAMARASTPEDYDTSKKRFEEQSRTERETRKRRMATGITQPKATSQPTTWESNSLAPQNDADTIRFSWQTGDTDTFNDKQMNHDSR